jgi:hypothetical protein
MESKQSRLTVIEEAKKNSRAAFDLTQQSLNELLKQRDHINKQITEHQQDLFRLAPMCGIDAKAPLASMGLTDAIRFLIADSLFGMTTEDIRDALIDAKFRLPESNPQAAIQTVLKRLQENGEIVDQYADDADRPPNWIWTSKDSAPSLPIPEWMIKSPEQIKKEKEAELQRQREKRQAKEAVNTITDDDIPF